jgi:hypothetical protein
MGKRHKNKVTHSIQVTPSEIYVSIGYISSFIGLCTMRLHTVLKGAEHIYRGKRRLYPFGKTILYLLEHNNFKYTTNLTSNGFKIRQIQGVLKR